MAHTIRSESAYEKGLLPQEDKKSLAMAYMCLTGITNPQDPANYLTLRDMHCVFFTLLAKKKRYLVTLLDRIYSFFSPYGFKSCLFIGEKKLKCYFPTKHFSTPVENKLPSTEQVLLLQIDFKAGDDMFFRNPVWGCGNE